MIISVDDKYRLRSDQNNWIIEKKVINKKTKEAYWNSESYYSSAESALKNLHALEIREISNLLEFEDVIQEVKVLHEKFKNIYKLSL